MAANDDSIDSAPPGTEWVCMTHGERWSMPEGGMDEVRAGVAYAFGWVDEQGPRCPLTLERMAFVSMPLTARAHGDAEFLSVASVLMRVFRLPPSLTTLEEVEDVVAALRELGWRRVVDGE